MGAGYRKMEPRAFRLPFLRALCSLRKMILLHNHFDLEDALEKVFVVFLLIYLISPRYPPTHLPTPTHTLTTHTANEVASSRVDGISRRQIRV